MNSVSPNQVPSGDLRLTSALEEYRALLEAGERPDRDAFLAAHSDAGPELADCLAGLEFVCAAVPKLPSSAGGLAMHVQDRFEKQATLGDFRIIREIARGGMGIVYEAEQISLGRRIALKVLPFAATMDPRGLQRFKNEAMAAAQLDHPNIVDVYGVGCERGVHYYAMRLIDGQTLAALIADLRQSEPARPPIPVGAEPRLGDEATVSSTAIRESSISLSPPTISLNELSTRRTDKPHEFYRAVADLAQQAAEALEHAHAQGVIHRDIKPSNLMVSGAAILAAELTNAALTTYQSTKVWITDFGLARITHPGTEGCDASLTMTGDLLGTVRYMSPEQTLAQRVLLDHRTDIYSLGATLYELLTLQPAFPGNDRQELLRQIAVDEPPRPSRLNRGIPAELETITLKAMEKNPADRYATAQQLADDLRRFLHDEPIRARPPTFVQRARKWSRRHPALVWSAAACLLVALATVSGALGWIANERSTRASRVHRDVTALLDDVEGQRRLIHEKLADPIRACELMSEIDGWREAVAKARAAWKSADRLAASNREVLPGELAERLRLVDGDLQTDETDWENAKRLDDIRLAAATLVAGKWDPEVSGPKYEAFFSTLGLDSGTPAEIASTVRQARLRYVLVAGLDDWCVAARKQSKVLLLAEIARLADPDGWRDAVRDPRTWTDPQGLTKLAREVNVAHQSPQSLRLLAVHLKKEESAALLRTALLQYPRDFWLHFELGISAPNPDQHIGCWQACLALRPKSIAALNNLGNALHANKDLDGAIRHFRKAIELDPDVALPHNNLGAALRDKKDFDGAIRHCRKAIELDPSSGTAHNNLGNALNDKKDFDGAIRHFRKAVELDPNNAGGHSNLGAALHDKKDLDGAIQHYRKAIELDPNLAQAHSNLGNALTHRKDLDGAIRHYRKAIELDPSYAKAHSNLGNALNHKKDFDGAIRHFRKAIEWDPSYALAHFNLGTAFGHKKDFDGAILHYRKAIELDPNFAFAHLNLGNALNDKKDLDGAIRHWRKAIELDPNHAGAYNNLGGALNDKKDLDGAIRHVRKAIELDPSHAIAHVNLGNALNHKKDLDGAIQHYRKAIELDPSYARAHSNLGSALGTKRDFEGAIRHFQRAIELDPKEVADHHNLGRALAEKKDFDTAILHYRKAIELQPDYAAAHKNLGTALRARNSLEGAIFHHRKAIELDPKDPDAHSELGIALRVKKDVEGAIQHYRKAIELNPRHVAAFINLGNVLCDKKNFADAIVYYRKAIELDPTHAHALYNLARALRDENDLDGAMAYYQKAIQVNPRYAEAHCNLGNVLVETGRFSDGLKHTRLGHELGAKQLGWRYPSAQWVRNYERLVRLDSEVAIVLKGQIKPKSLQEWVGYVDVCRMKKAHASAFQLWNQLFEAHPAVAGDTKSVYRIRAAVDAVLGATDRDRNAATITDAGRSAMRKQACAWLHADLDARRPLLERKQPHAALAVATLIAQWQEIPDLAEVRDAPKLAKLPEDERQAWQKLWTDAQQLRKRADGMFKTTRLTGEVAAMAREPVHEVELKAGVVYAIDLQSKTFDAFLRLHDAQGKKLAENDDIVPGVNLNSRLTFKPTTGGIYRLAASAFQNQGVGAYTLTIREFVGGKTESVGDPPR